MAVSVRRIASSSDSLSSLSASYWLLNILLYFDSFEKFFYNRMRRIDFKKFSA
jgi:hypothetical protein